MTAPRIDVGNLDVRIRIESLVRTEDQGYHASAWAHHATVWAAERVVSSSSEKLTDRAIARTVVDFMIHRRRDITNRMRVIRGRSIFEVSEIIPDPVARRWTTLRCVEQPDDQRPEN